jgi:hypothetical protein
LLSPSIFSGSISDADTDSDMVIYSSPLVTSVLGIFFAWPETAAKNNSGEGNN